jgi:hypothetical protein
MLAVLGVAHISWGVPAVLAPRFFFDNFPGFGRHWTAAYPPYNEHLMTDVGAAFTALGVLLLIACWLLDRRVTATVLTGLIVFSGLHLAFHWREHGMLRGTDLTEGLVTLALGVLIPAALLVLNWARPPRRESAPPR